MVRVALDANTLVAGTITPRGPAGALIAAMERGDVILVTCEQVIGEYEEVLLSPRITRKYAGVTAENVAASAAALRAYSVLVDVNEPPRVVPDDPDDDALLAAAVVGHADWIVTRDQHLLALEAHHGIPIVSPEQALRSLETRRP